MEMTSWNNWVKKINDSSIDQINSEISVVQGDNSTPFVEKNLKLGYLYYSKDFLGTATKIFKNLSQKISAEKNNFEFINENEKGLNVLRMANPITIICEDAYDCCSEGIWPFCGCLGIVAVMAICGIAAEDITTCDTTDGKGCCDNGLNGICNCCCGWYVEGSGSEGSTCIG